MPLSLSASRRPGLLRVAGMLVLLAALLWVPHVPPSHAAPVGGGWTRGTGVHAAVHFVGQYKDSRGQVAYCTDFERLSPENAGAYDDGHSGGFVRSDGSALNATENAALSYLLHRWGATADNTTAASVQLAVWALTSPGMAWDSPGMNAVLKAERLPADVVAQARSMTRAAFNEAGPHEVAIKLEAAAADGVITAVIGVVGAKGEPAAGLAAEATVTGPFALAKEAASTWTSGKEPYRLRLERTGLGSGSVAVTLPRAPAAGVKWLLPSRRDAQRLLVAAVVEPREAAAAIADLPAFQPAVVTRTSTARTAAGTPIHDVLTVSTPSPPEGSPAIPAPWLAMPGSTTPVSVEVVSTLWGPLEAKPVLQDSVPEGTPSVGTVTTRVDGPGTYETGGLVVPAPGWYVWTEFIAPESALPAVASPYVLGWQGRFGVEAETTFVPWTPEISTELSAHDVLVGDRVTDSVTGVGFGTTTTDSGGTVTLSMYGPLAERPSLSAEVPADARLHSELTVPALNGIQQSEPFAAFAAPGCYTVVASFTGDDHTDPFTSPFGEPSETVCVQAAEAVEPAEPAMEETPTTPGPAADITTPVPPQHRPELAQTGIRAEVAAGMALVLLGAGLGCLRLAGVRRPRKGAC